MPSIDPIVSTYTRPSAIPEEVWWVFEANPATSNIIYAQALKTRRAEQKGRPAAPGQAWITSSVMTRGGLVPDFILSCSEGAMGSYPIFIFTTLPASSLRPELLYARLYPMAHALYKAVSTQRVYSVFAVDAVAQMFISIWTKFTGIAPEPEAYYHAMFSRLPRRLFRDCPTTRHHGYDFDLRPATVDDIPRVAALCKGFASTSDPFTLDNAGSMREARVLVSSRQVWVHTARAPDGREGIASLVAFTRNTDTVSAITKVYTNPDWRKLGCAERLVRRVCRYLLLEQGKEEVVLYVAHENAAAAGVYRRVGFLGLNGAPADGVDSWIEIGLDQRRVKLGHW